VRRRESYLPSPWAWSLHLPWFYSLQNFFPGRQNDCLSSLLLFTAGYDDDDNSYWTVLGLGRCLVAQLRLCSELWWWRHMQPTRLNGTPLRLPWIWWMQCRQHAATDSLTRFDCWSTVHMLYAPMHTLLGLDSTVCNRTIRTYWEMIVCTIKTCSSMQVDVEFHLDQQVDFDTILHRERLDLAVFHSSLFRRQRPNSLSSPPASGKGVSLLSRCLPLRLTWGWEPS
jgi:hypothetical protein